MVTISRVRVGWTNWLGGPGVSTFYYAAPPTGAQLTGLRTFFDAQKVNIPAGIQMQVENQGQQIDTATGQAVDTWTAAAQTVITGTGSGGYVSVAGYYIRWNTGLFSNGRAVRGKTYMIPCTPPVFDTDGTINGATIASIQAAVTAFMTSTSGGLVVYSPTAKNGFVATSGTVMDKQVVLRSRRD